MNTVQTIGSPIGSPLVTAAPGDPGVPVAPGPTPGYVASPTSRDSQIGGLSDISSSVNSLQQAALSQSTASAPLLSLPQLPPMPAPKPAPAVPSDDHGQSNIVFSDAGSDGTLIH